MTRPRFVAVAVLAVLAVLVDPAVLAAPDCSEPSAPSGVAAARLHGAAFPAASAPASFAAGYAAAGLALPGGVPGHQVSPKHHPPLWRVGLRPSRFAPFRTDSSPCPVPGR